jgi:hypothetical protein
MQHVTNILHDYLDDTLGKEEHAKVASHLKTCAVCQEELEQLQALFGAFETEAVVLPSKKVKETFLEALAEEQRKTPRLKPLRYTKQKGKTGYSYFLKIAASVALLAGAFALGRYANTKQANDALVVQQNKTMEVQQTAMISLLGNQSASKRIQGANLITAFEEPDEEIINALADRMFLDENTNVRLTAVEALAVFAHSETVKTAFIKALATEKDPSVQIALIQNLVRIQASKAAGPLKRLLQLEETQPFVKEEINRVLPELI